MKQPLLLQGATHQQRNLYMRFRKERVANRRGGGAGVRSQGEPGGCRVDSKGPHVQGTWRSQPRVDGGSHAQDPITCVHSALDLCPLQHP